MSQSAFPLNPVLTAIAVGYKNPDVSLIADAVLPRVDVAGLTFKYTRYSVADAFTVPDTKVGRKSQPTQVDFGGTQDQATCVDQGLDDFLPNVDLDAWAAAPKAPGAVSPQAKSTSLLAGLIDLAREVRVANMVFSAANYAPGQSAALSGTSMWSDYANSDPLSTLLAALDVPVMRPNKMVIGQAAWTRLRQHPVLLKSFNKSSGDKGTITREYLAQLLEINEVVVGSSFVNTARRGQAVQLQRTWGKHCALLYVSQAMADADQPQFGFTAQWGGRIAGNIPDAKMGLRGGETIRVGESVIELVCDPSSGYLFQNIVA